MNYKLSKSLLALAIAGVCNGAIAEDNLDSDIDTANKEYLERIQIIGHDEKLRTESGSATLIGEAELEKFKFDDINRVLYNVPGVNIREEDGFGLRPNIGFRGATPERSKKITVMEDGVLIGPAPYSAPAAYYFPMMNKMTALEVFKGPAAIKYGPNTVAGALNMTTRHIPDGSEGEVDFSLGSNGYQKAKGYYGNTNGRFGYLVEVVHLQSDGFKELDGGGDTGFDKNDVMTKFNYDLSNNGYSQLVELKWSYADEISDETYLGLTDEDFQQNANRRYAASQLDKMDWQHQQVQLTHFIGNERFDVTTRIYRNDFKRSWYKINGFKNGLVHRDLQEILANPDDEINTDFYQILTGVRDSEKEYQKIILGDNNRKYYSQGIQSELYLDYDFLGLVHEFNAGVRFHQDQIKRRHTEDAYLMESAELRSDGSETIATTTNLEKTDAWSVFIKDKIFYHDLEMTLGVRGEFFQSKYQNQAPGQQDDWLEKHSKIWLPSFSAFYKFSDKAGMFFGVHEGFIPTSPKEHPVVEIENSVNYELGARYKDNGTQAEAVVFYNNIKNLKESCSFSAAASCGDNLDAEYNSGKAVVYGLELTLGHSFALNSLFDMPVSLTYTHTQSEFSSAFTSDFPMWGIIEKGDNLPYQPENQLSLNLGLAASAWQVSVTVRYVDDMLEASGDDVLLSDVMAEAHTVIDVSASYEIGDYGSLYLKIDNLMDEQEVISRRPYGARPGKAQQAFIGYQYSF
ncbi:TonB-dependent receptor [Thalassotalea insulae]|uniref:TonB-dependent receptor n=1 Tax=Thalassotalea insulae TaxID=2056778 RepID=A0ABQ6GSB8_9GAMM|nr:TonB-dependent receptor [Thalassotalea insulae]GLX78851.1 TonB-dependent receptor [Thalassotalea insulae]